MDFRKLDLSTKAKINKISLNSGFYFFSLVVLYFLFALCLSPYSFYQMDSYYYWDWSRHLALSYYDGPPMIAYWIRLSTILFGDSQFSLGVVATVSTFITAWMFFKTARLFLDKKSSWVALLLWLFSPLVTMDLLHQVTYDNPQMTFWVMSMYFIIKYLNFQRTSYLYFTAISLGFLLLSKYTGIVLILTVVIFMLGSPHRTLLRSKHFYLACGLVLFMFSPVLIWNYQHEWVSFIYQLKTHQLPESSMGGAHILEMFTLCCLPYLNVLLVLPVYCLKKKYSQRSISINFCLVQCVIFLFFYLFISLKAAIRPYWFAPYTVSGALLFGAVYQSGVLQKLAQVTVLVYILASVSILVENSSFLYVPKCQKIATYELIRQFNHDYPQMKHPIFVSSWMAARPFFFLKGHPKLYTFPCSHKENQYQLWSKDMVRLAQEKKLKKAYYMDIYDTVNCAKPYFDRCQRLKTKPYSQGEKSHELYVYHCLNFD